MTLSYSHAHQQGSGTTEVVAVLVAITEHTARVLTVDQGKLLPNGPLMPLHRSLQAGVRQWVEEQTQQPLGYLEQLYTFVDTNRRNVDGHAHVVPFRQRHLSRLHGPAILQATELQRQQLGQRDAARHIGQLQLHSLGRGDRSIK